MLYDQELSLVQLILIFDFLQKLSTEVECLLEGTNLKDSVDFDGFISLKEITLISIYNKNFVLIKYYLSQMYQMDELNLLIKNISDNLMLLNLVDPIIASKVWKDAFDKTLVTYFFYFVFIFEAGYTKKDLEDGSNPRLEVFKTEVERLTQFFAHFVTQKVMDENKARSQCMIEYLEARDDRTLMEKLERLIKLRAVTSTNLLVGDHYSRAKLLPSRSLTTLIQRM